MGEGGTTTAPSSKVPLARVLTLPEREELARLREIPADRFQAGAEAIRVSMRTSFEALREKGDRS